MEIKIVSCNLCGGNNFEPFIKRKEAPLSKCQNCGLIFVNPQPSEKDLNKIYQKEYFKGNKQQKKSISYGDYLNQKSAHIKYFNQKIAQIKKIKKKGKILDIGCALGFFLEVAKKAGYKVCGTDISKFAVDYVKKNLKLDVRSGQLEKLKLKSNSFDIVTLFSMFEHIKDPKKLLEETRRILKPKGILLLTTPDGSSFWAKVLGRYWWGYNHKTHLFIFNKKTIRDIFKKIGFTKINIEKDTPIYVSIKDILIKLKFSHGWHFADKIIFILGPVSKWNFIPFPAMMSVRAFK